MSYICRELGCVGIAEFGKDRCPKHAKDHCPEHAKDGKNAADILADMAETFRERNKVYGDNYKRVGDVMIALFPNGVNISTAEEFNKWHLFELMIVKLTRFANSNLTHIDSIHDCAVYAAMVQSLTEKEQQQ